MTLYIENQRTLKLIIIYIYIYNIYVVKGKAFSRAEVDRKLKDSLALQETKEKLESLLEGDISAVSSDLYDYMDRLFVDFMDSVRVFMVGECRGVPSGKSRTRLRRKSSRMHKQAWYDSECKAAAKVMHASVKWPDKTQRQRAYNEYRNLCRRKREAWLAERLNEIDHVLNVDKSRMWDTVNRMLGINEPSEPQVDSHRLREYYANAFNVDSASAETIEAPAQPIPLGRCCPQPS